ncbi:BnaC07g50770D [Brassica napus]|uniref:(rape) hypothetical protein n=1 Tax=Brassica napus TaxID=3708 RepID=A0A078IT06_BRANA|nr:unnamed protein product [Brassica napus]CDY54275.1 BnaC07g50770D [Brassica napus]
MLGYYFGFIRSRNVDAFSQQNLHSLITEATPLAQSLTSKRRPHIAIGRGSNGLTYVGFDVELPDLPLNFSIHAVQFLVVSLKLNFDLALRDLAISNDGSHCYAPCGHCCQFLQEINKGNEIQTLITEPTGSGFMPLEMLLPQSFSRYSAISDDVPDVFHRRYPLTFIDRSHDLIGLTAMTAARNSYAPYSNAPSGVVLYDRQGHKFSGSYIESVAAFPSLGPLQAVLVNFVIDTGGREFKNIVVAVLVETRSRFRQEDTARMIMQKIAPGCKFNVYHCSHYRAESS